MKSVAETPLLREVPRLLAPGEVGALFGVDVGTVRQWADDGKFSCIRTLGGHRRYRESEILAALENEALR